MAGSVIALKGVTKKYGSARGISSVSFEVPAGQVYGFLGPNGAGKTTTISLMVDLIRPTSGQIKIFGLDSTDGSLEIRRRIGYLTDDMALDKGLTGWQQLEYFGNLRGEFDRSNVTQLAKRLQSNLNRKIKTLSRGNRQKIGLISALMHNPELLILDEPTSGLDPIIQQEFNKIILERKVNGQTTFISSHMLSEVQEICDEVAFIREGKLIAVKNLGDIGESLPKKIHLHTSDQTLITKIKKMPAVTDVKHLDQVINFMYKGDINKLLSVLSKHKLGSLTISEADLETVFMQYYERKHV